MAFDARRAQFRSPERHGLDLRETRVRPREAQAFDPSTLVHPAPGGMTPQRARFTPPEPNVNPLKGASPPKAVVPKGTTAKRKIKTVLHEFKEGALRSSSGGKVTARKQAVAIALSEARRATRKRR